MTESAPIGGFELHRNGMYWWTASDKCAQLPPIAGAVGLLPDRALGKKISTALSGCAFLNSAESSPTRDDAYLYFFAGGSLQRLPYSKANQSAGLPLPNPVDLPAGQADPPLIMLGKRLYWIEGTTSTSVASCEADGGDRRVDAALSPTAFPVLRFTAHESPTGVNFFALERSSLNARRGAALHAWIDSKPSKLDHLGVDFVDYGYALKGSQASLFAATGPRSQLDPTRSLVELDPNTGDVAAGALIYDSAKELYDIAVDATRVFWTETYASGPDMVKDLQQRPLRSGVPALLKSQIVQEPDVEIVNTRADGDAVYWISPGALGGGVIVRFPVEPEIHTDLIATHLEAVQTIQRLTPSTDVLLVAGKRTYARGYATMTSDSLLLPRYRADALLTGKLNGVPLAGSVASTDRALMRATDTLDGKRRSVVRSFLFELPLDWIRVGALELAMTVDPSAESYENGTLTNNTVSSSAAIVEKGSPCLELVSTYFCRSAFRSGFTPGEMPGFAQILARAESLLPARGLRWFMRDFEPIRLPGYSPPCFENSEVPACFRIMNFGYLLSGGAPASLNCDAHLRVGMVPYDVPASPSSGIAFAGVTNIVVKFQESGSAAYDSPYGGVILAHEMGHSYNLLHIRNETSCGQDPAGPYGVPPFPANSCWLGPNAPDAYFGFDPISRSIIAPDMAGELMSYAWNTWPANTFWDFMLARLPNPRTTAAAPPPSRPGLAPAALSDPLMAVTGTLDGVTSQTELMTIYTFEPGAAPANGVDESALREAAALNENSPYLARQLASADETLRETPLLFTRGVEASVVLNTFFQYVPLAPGAARLQIVGAGKILAERKFTAAAPVTVAGTPVYDAGADRLKFDWSATDSDSPLLRHTVQFSSDAGQSWSTLLLDVPDSRASFNAAGLKGGNGRLLRVLTSDGARSAVAISSPFDLPVHPPLLRIGGVVPGGRVGFGTPVELHATASDADDFEVPDDSIDWSLSGPRIASAKGREFRLDDLEPGSYLAGADAVDSDALHAMQSLAFEVLPPAIPDAADPLFELDGVANEDGYDGAIVLHIPIDAERFITARLVHSEKKLHVAFENLQLGAGDPPGSFAGIRIDLDASADAAAQADDVAFFVNELGEISASSGDGQGGMPPLDAAPLGFSAAIRRGGFAWTAELEIDESLIGGWDHGVRIEAGQFSIAAPGDALFWPAASQRTSPAAWAPAWLGALPPQPNRAPVASAGPDQSSLSATGEEIILSGEASYDPDGDPLDFSWTQVAGPAVVLSDAQSARPEFTLGELAAETVFTFKLVANDGQLSSDPSLVTLTLQPQLATLGSVSEGILAYMLGLFGDPTGLDQNSDGVIDIADYIQSRAATLP